MSTSAALVSSKDSCATAPLSATAGEELTGVVSETLPTLAFLAALFDRRGHVLDLFAPTVVSISRQTKPRLENQ